jgi:hypothetical protein
MNVEIGTEAPQFPETVHINGIFLQCGVNGRLSPRWTLRVSSPRSSGAASAGPSRAGPVVKDDNHLLVT